MEIGVLGPLVVRIDGTSVVPSAAKPRQMLALLAVNAGWGVKVTTLTEELWDSSPPSGPAGVVQTYVKQLRRAIALALGPEHEYAPKEVLSRSYAGYALNMPVPVMEADLFEQLTGRGLRALADGDDATASKLLGEALAMWRGPALADVRIGPALRVELLRLEEARRSALEGRITADLRLGRHTEVIGELLALTERFPLQESLHALLMLALYRSGRSWQALETFRKLRASTAQELGIEPSLRVQRLHRAILAADPRLDLDTPSLAAF
ncbi:AfsR/SARP family transcriptional regulator [Streptomyces sp. RY43-2]|uniref:AfsR/SARP family transcriptional regulator n=1 Tax=Streptomyces macrolidinus TaxID=2952607 RepID=A0ABT0ZFN6_9ACTN|nr:AfsR/SARP family transcriptional regulator [Streptomyces macrolidinus]MCN9242388.1 AfsR/SARP family transcriptional regulator [Streptomyces macrolidinus]